MPDRSILAPSWPMFQCKNAETWAQPEVRTHSARDHCLVWVDSAVLGDWYGPHQAAFLGSTVHMSHDVAPPTPHPRHTHTCGGGGARVCPHGPWFADTIRCTSTSSAHCRHYPHVVHGAARLLEPHTRQWHSSLRATRWGCGPEPAHFTVVDRSDGRTAGGAWRASTSHETPRLHDRLIGRQSRALIVPHPCVAGTHCRGKAAKTCTARSSFSPTDSRTSQRYWAEGAVGVRCASVRRALALRVASLPLFDC